MEPGRNQEPAGPTIISQGKDTAVTGSLTANIKIELPKSNVVLFILNYRAI